MDKGWHDIEKYRKGELSAPEMHALEKRALTDPFLADALEGAGDLDTEAFSADLGELRKRLHARTDGSASVTPPWWWMRRVAAGVALVGVASFVLFQFFGEADKRNDHLALNKEHNGPFVPERDSVTADKVEKIVPQKAVEESQPAPSPSAARPSRSSDKLTPPPSRQLPQAPDIAAAREHAVPAPAPATDPAARSSMRKETEPVQAESEEASVDGDNEPAAIMESRAALKAEKRMRPASRLVRGQVVDAEEGKGLPGVNVTIKGTSTGTVTDAEGNYEIPLDDLNEGLVFSFIGFESTEVIPGSKNEVNVELQPDMSQLSEVVVVGYGEKKADDFSDTYPRVELAEPEGGKKAFKQYLEHNLRYPEQALNNKIEGKVTVQFTIESTGQLSDFKILKGLGYGCDEEVIRLIKSGPKWSATKRNAEPVRDKVKVRLKFALPKK